MISINLSLILYWISGIMTYHKTEQMVLLLLSLGQYNILGKISLTTLFISQLLRSMRYINVFGVKGIIALMLFSVSDFVKCYIKINWLGYVEIGLGIITYVFLTVISWRRNIALRPMMKRLAVLYFVILITAGIARYLQKPKLLMVVLLIGINDHSHSWRLVENC